MNYTIITTILKNANLLVKIGGRLAHEGRITQQQWVLLEALQKSGKDGIHLSYLGKNLLVTKSNITGLIRRLENGGYVRTERNDEDRRVLKAKLTSKGINSLKKIKKAEEKWHRECFRDFPENERKRYLELLEKHFKFLYSDVYKN